jgi:hypothetical protein
MDPARRGIAYGSSGQPEEAGIFLTSADIEGARLFILMGRGRSLDVWQVDVRGLPLRDLSLEGGWWLCTQPIPPERLELVQVWNTDNPDEPRLLALPDPDR